MFTIYHSNQLNALQSLLCSVIDRNPLAESLQPEMILVPGPSMAQWLKIKLAERFGVSANVTFLLPAEFIWDLFIKVSPNIQKENPLSRDAITWKLMHLLPELLNVPVFSPLRNYLTEDNEKRKIYQLTSRIADLFNQYLVYRPQWLESWQRGKRISGLSEDQAWQAPLWEKLVQYTRKLGQSPWNLSNFKAHLISAMENNQYCFSGLPNRIFVCGLLTLPEIYLDILQALGRHIDLHLMSIAPCRYYCGGSQDYNSLNPLKILERRYNNKRLKKNLFLKPAMPTFFFRIKENKVIQNPLLTSFGKLGGDYFHLLSRLERAKEIQAFVDIPTDNMLHFIQHNILELNDHMMTTREQKIIRRNIKKRRLELKDDSISLHLCHSQYREVEVLYDQLLRMLEADPELTPRDIVVMVADIDSYSPFIEAVFGKVSSELCLPFSISKCKEKQLNTVLKTFISLIDLLQSRFTVEKVLGILEVPALALRFSINKEELSILRHLVLKSGIRWGLNDEHVRDLELPVTGQYTWFFGIKRMLLGYAMDSNTGDWKDILPYDEANGSTSELVGKLSNLITSFDSWREKLKETRSLEEWLPVCHQLLDAFFIKDIETERAIRLIEQHWQKVISLGLAACYQDAVPFNILLDDLVSHLDQISVTQYFVSDQVNFCTLMEIQSIPFKVVCLLGMNDGAYPVILSPLGFNMIAQKPKIGDRNERDYELYLFLITILSAQQKLYISFINCSIQDNRERHPSLLVSQLLEYLKQSYFLPCNEHLDDDRSSEGVGEYLMHKHTRMPFSPKNFIPGSKQQSYAAEWLPAANRVGKVPIKFSQPLPPEGNKKILLDDLKQFYRHPIRAFFHVRLGVNFSWKETEIRNEEPFVLDSISRYELNTQLLNTLIENEDESNLFHRIRASGKLPFGTFGVIYWEKQKEEVTKLAKRVQAERAVDCSLELNIEINGTLISGWLHHVQHDGLIRYQPTLLSVSDGMQLWLEHLMYCRSGASGTSRLYGLQESAWRFLTLTPEDAHNHLIRLIEGYQYGLCQPLLLLNKSGWVWLSSCYQPKTKRIDWQKDTQIKAQEKLLQVWHGDQSVVGEGRDPYIHRALRHLSLDSDEFSQILVETERYFLPLARHNIA